MPSFTRRSSVALRLPQFLNSKPRRTAIMHRSQPAPASRHLLHLAYRLTVHRHHGTTPFRADSVRKKTKDQRIGEETSWTSTTTKRIGVSCPIALAVFAVLTHIVVPTDGFESGQPPPPRVDPLAARLSSSKPKAPAARRGGPLKLGAPTRSSALRVPMGAYCSSFFAKLSS